MTPPMRPVPASPPPDPVKSWAEGRRAAELAHNAEALQAALDATAEDNDRLRAELDRQRALISSLLEECDRRERNVERDGGCALNAAITCDGIRRWLVDGERRVC